MDKFTGHPFLNKGDAITKMLDAVDWVKAPPPGEIQPGQEGIPHVTHSGILDVGGIKLRVFQLSDGKRIVDAEDIERLFTMVGL